MTVTCQLLLLLMLNYFYSQNPLWLATLIQISFVVQILRIIRETAFVVYIVNCVVYSLIGYDRMFSC